jgi:hypothetical protein
MKLVSIVKNIISESDKRSSIKSIFGFSDEWVDKFHEINPKLSIWVASTFVEDFIKRKMSSLDDFMKNGKVGPNKSKILLSGETSTNQSIDISWIGLLIQEEENK